MLVVLYNIKRSPLRASEPSRIDFLPFIMSCYLHVPILLKLSLVERADFFPFVNHKLGCWTIRQDIVLAGGTLLLTFFFLFHLRAFASKSPFGSPCSPGVTFSGRFLGFIGPLCAPEFYVWQQWVISPIKSAAISMAPIGGGGAWYVISAFLVRSFNPAIKKIILSVFNFSFLLVPLNYRTGTYSWTVSFCFYLSS